MREKTPGSSSSRSIARLRGRIDQLLAGYFQLVSGLGLLGYLYLIVWRRDLLDAELYIYIGQVLLYGVVGTLAYRFARERSTMLFGIFLLTTSTTYSSSAFYLSSVGLDILGKVASLIQHVQFQFLIAWYLWRFIEIFPTEYAPTYLRVVIRVFKISSLVTGCFYVLIGLGTAWLQISFREQYFENQLPSLLLAVKLLGGYAWYTIFPQITIGIGVLLLKARFLKGQDRARSSLFVLGLAMSFGLASVGISMESLFLWYRALMKDELYRPTIFFSTNCGILLMPLITGYAIFAHRVMDFQQIARGAVRYLFARYSATALTFVPFGLLVAYVVLNKEHTIADLLGGTEAILLTGLTVLGLILMRFRQVLVDAIDRRFFRDRYNARLVLTDLAEKVRGTRNLTELSKLVGSGVDLALHLNRVSLLVLDSAQGRYADPLEQIRSLDTASKLTTILQGSREPLVVDFDDTRSPLHDLGDADKHWLIDGEVELLSPAHALDGNMIGILALGSKKSAEPYVAEDKELVKGVCSSTGLVIELLQLKENAPTADMALTPEISGATEVLERPVDSQQVARECLACSRVYPPSEARCPRCKVELEPTVIPFVLRGQYRFESRLGTGGMAVVYRATDLRLGREVAIKTLPQVSPEAAMRLHREARTAATVTDSGLAAIYGIETWEGMPLLIQEFLRAGTLSDRLLAGQPLTPTAAIEMGKTVAAALQKIHSVGILHRDLKPSNIGYTQDGEAKLLDFGVARIHQDWRQDVESGDVEDLDGRSRIQNTASWVIARTATGQLVGTVGYLSPEAVMGHRPEPSVDLWALSVVLWESMAGVNLFTGRSFQVVLERIRDVKVAKLGDHLSDCPQSLAEFFAKELHPDKMKRARSGREMFERLEQLRLDLGS